MKKLINLILCLSIFIAGQAQVSKTVNVTTAGKLSAAFTPTEKNTVTNLTITGTIDARDFKFMRDTLSVLTVLDLSATTISRYGGTAGPSFGSTSNTVYSYTYHANEIPLNAFDNGSNYQSKTSLKTITFPSSITSIGSYAFSGCTGLTSITFPSSVTSIESDAFSGCTRLTSITIPSSVTSIGSSAFSGTAWYNSQPDGVVYAGKVAYKYKGTMWSGASITLNTGTIGIADEAFSYCSNLTSITIPNSVTSIGNSAFYGTAWYNSQPDGVLYINKIACAYKGTTTNTAILKEGTIGIADGAFQTCRNLTSISIPNSVTSIGDKAFLGCSNLISITIPNSVVSIGDEAFYQCDNLTSITFPNSVTSIGDDEFQQCERLTSITIPSSVTFIGQGAFNECSNLTSIYAYPTTPVDISGSYSVFYGVSISYSCILYVPKGSKAAYQAANQWKDFTNIVEMTTSLPALENENIRLYPNLVNDVLHITGLTDNASLQLLDLNGRVTMSKQVCNNEAVSVSLLPQGMYIVKLKTTEGTFETKLIKN